MAQNTEYKKLRSGAKCSSALSTVTEKIQTLRESLVTFHGINFLEKTIKRETLGIIALIKSEGERKPRVKC